MFFVFLFSSSNFIDGFGLFSRSSLSSFDATGLRKFPKLHLRLLYIFALFGSDVMPEDQIKLDILH